VGSLKQPVGQPWGWKYNGSLTMPLCADGVPWFVSGAVGEGSLRQFYWMKSFMGFNARFTMPITGQPPKKPPKLVFQQP